MLPVTFAPGGSRPMMASEVTDFPEPDSPTKPKTSPGLIEKLTLRTAAIIRGADAAAGEGPPSACRGAAPAILGNSIVRSRTSRSGDTSVWYQRSGNSFHGIEELF